MKLAVFFFLSLTCAPIYGHDHQKSRHAHSRHSHLKHRDNSGENQTSTINPEINSTECLSISYNESTRFELVYNATEQTGAAIDSNNSVVVIFNDKSNVAIAIDIKLERGVQLRCDGVNGSWKAYLSVQVSLKEVIESRQGSSFNITSPPPEVCQQAEPILQSLSPQYSQLITFIGGISVITSVNEKLSQSSSFSAQFHGDFFVLVQRYQILWSLYRNSSLGNNSAPINLGPPLSQPLNIDFLREFFKQLSSSQLNDILGNSLQSRDSFLSFISRYDSTARAISYINATRHGNCSVQDLIKSLIEHQSAGLPDRAQWTSSYQSLVNELLQRSQSGGSSGQNSQNSNILNILGGGQNSDIINALFTTNQRGGIFNIVQILSIVRPQVPPNESLPNVLGQLFSFYRSRNSTSALTNIIPSGSTSQFGVGRIVQQFIEIFMRAIQIGVEIAAFFMSLPIRFIVVPMIAAVEEFFKDINLTDLFQSRSAIEWFIRGLMVFVRIPFAFFAALVKGFETAIESGVQLGEEFVEGVAHVAQGSSEGSQPGQVLQGVFGGLSREHGHVRHAHEQRHHAGKGKKHEHHVAVEKRHEIRHRLRDTKEKKNGIRQRRHDIKQKKHEVRHS